MNTKVIFFDLGGTLLVMRRDRVFRRVLAEEGRDVPLDMIHSAYMQEERRWLIQYGNRRMDSGETNEAYRSLDRRVFSVLFPDEPETEALRVSGLVRKRWPELGSEIPLALYPDAEPALSSLKDKGYAMGLISNAPADTQSDVEALGLSKYLDPVVISGAVGCSKPNPEIFRIALREVGARPNEAIHVGDLYEADVVGARSAGMEGILLDREGTYAGLDCPRIRSLSEIYPRLR